MATEFISMDEFEAIKRMNPNSGGKPSDQLLAMRAMKTGTEIDNCGR